jgi:signal transduction histidine kinase
MNAREPQKEPSLTEIAIVNYDAELERISALYGSLAMRIAMLERDPLTATGQEQQQNAVQTNAAPDKLTVFHDSAEGNWLRILRHMTPHKLRQLLADHDRIEQMQSEVRNIRDTANNERGQLLAQKAALERELLAQIISVQSDFLMHMQSELRHLRGRDI